MTLLAVIARSSCDEAIQGPRDVAPGLLRCANKKQTVTALILLEKLCTEKEKRRHRSLAKNQVGTGGISERRFIQGDRPEAGRELAMTNSASQRATGAPVRQE